MKLYAVRDRLLDYFMAPFVGPSEKEVLAAIAKAVNTIEANNDINQAPHHFEVWELAEVQDDGHIVPTRRLIADCSSLVRPGLRDRAGPGSPEAQGAVRQGLRGPQAAPEPRGANGGPVPTQVPPADNPPQNAAQAAGRGD